MLLGGGVAAVSLQPPLAQEPILIRAHDLRMLWIKHCCNSRFKVLWVMLCMRSVSEGVIVEFGFFGCYLLIVDSRWKWFCWLRHKIQFSSIFGKLLCSSSFLGLDLVWGNCFGDVIAITVIRVLQIHASCSFQMSSKFMVLCNTIEVWELWTISHSFLSFLHWAPLTSSFPVESLPAFQATTSHRLNKRLHMLLYNHGHIFLKA